jgi:hypothetical protein
MYSIHEAFECKRNTIITAVTAEVWITFNLGIAKIEIQRIRLGWRVYLELNTRSLAHLTSDHLEVINYAHRTPRMTKFYRMPNRSFPIRSPFHISSDPQWLAFKLYQLLNANLAWAACCHKLERYSYSVLETLIKISINKLQPFLL